MALLEKYVSPRNKVVDLIESLSFPLSWVPAGSHVLVITDTNMDPVIWETVMGILRQRQCEPTLTMYTPRAHHTAEPPAPVNSALDGVQFCVLLTTTSLAHSDFYERARELDIGALLMEEATVEILTSPGCRLDASDWQNIFDRGVWVRQYWMRGGHVHLTSPAGTDLTAELAPGPERNADPADALLAVQKNGRRRGGTWPYGENRVTPLEGTGQGTVVWDVCAHHPPGRFAEPVVLSIENGKVVNIDGGREAEEIRSYLATHGDENVMNAPAEISLGTNHRAQVLGNVRNDKKSLGTAHVAIGRSDIGGAVVSNIHFDGIIWHPTVSLDGEEFVKDGVLGFDRPEDDEVDVQ